MSMKISLNDYALQAISKNGLDSVLVTSFAASLARQAAATQMAPAPQDSVNALQDDPQPQIDKMPSLQAPTQPAPRRAATGLADAGLILPRRTGTYPLARAGPRRRWWGMGSKYG